MKTLPKLTLALVLALGLGAGSARASTFDFSYLFDDGLVVSGSLTGAANGDFVENISNVAVRFNGDAMPGTIFTSMFDGGSYLNGPVVSFDALLNNFLFANSDLANGDFGYDSVFYMLNASVASDTAVAFSTMGYASQDDPSVGRRWTLVQVPDHGATLALLGLALAALGSMRRKC